jgi:hypothetical protein
MLKQPKWAQKVSFRAAQFERSLALARPQLVYDSWHSS